ncbi:hypothetical protein BGZ76_009456 [Entomortierella beljakovae]|nr:hypothetical protein BGZ76_009456 [Entomortierella beljakovae]
MSSILNVLRSAPSPTRHFTSLQIVATSRAQSATFNPEHHPIVLQQLVDSLSPSSFVTPSTEATSASSGAIKDSFSGKTPQNQSGSEAGRDSIELQEVFTDNQKDPPHHAKSNELNPVYQPHQPNLHLHPQNTHQIYSQLSSSENAIEDLRVVSSVYSNQSEEPSDTKAESSSTNPFIIQEGSARLEEIRSSVFEFLSERNSAHEYTVPRLFIALPVNEVGKSKDNGTTAAEGKVSGTILAGTSQTIRPQYRLYFLCECSVSFTLPLGSELNHLHIAKHTGYEIDPNRQDEFFKQYGAMILSLLYYLKYGHDLGGNLPSTIASSQVSAYVSMHRQGPGTQNKTTDVDTEISTLKKIAKISSLRRSDLPDSISQDVEAKFDRMIEFLERSRAVRSEPTEYTHTNNNTDQGGASRNETEGKGSKDDKKLRGLVSLSDLHHLYSFLGIANTNIRLQSGQLGNLYRISNVKGQVSWVCVYHYRWTFLERNIDEFEQWVVARRGLFDKQSGSVSITLYSRAHTRTFCTWIVSKMAPSLVEAHIKLGWSFGKKDLWRLAKALACSTVTVLSLDGCSYAEDSTYKILHKKYDPILYLLAHGQIRSFELLRFPSMFKRLSSKNANISTLRRLQFGRGMYMNIKDRKSLTHLLSSCASLEEVIFPGFIETDQHVHAIITGIRSCKTLVTLDLSDSQLGDSAAIALAQGLYSTQISQLDLSKNESLSDKSAARIIQAAGPRLTSLKMSQTGFGDLAAIALAKTMDGVSFSNTLQDQLLVQNRLDVAIMATGHRPGLRFIGENPLAALGTPLPPLPKRSREKTHQKGNLVYLDIEDNYCTKEGFKALAAVKARLYFIHLNISGSRDLQDKVCAQILDRVASSALVSLRLACTGFGSLSAKSLARAILIEPPISSEVYKRTYGVCQLEDLDLQACPIDSESLALLRDALIQSQALPYLKTLDLGHCGYLHDGEVQQLLKATLVPNGTELPNLSGERSKRILGSQSLRSISTLNRVEEEEHKNSFVGQSQGTKDGNEGSSSGLLSIPLDSMNRNLAGPSSGPASRSIVVQNSQDIVHPLNETLEPIAGFFSNLQNLDLKSTEIGDGSAWLLAQAIVQPTTLLTSLTVLDPVGMSMQGICWIVDAMSENSTVREFGIGKVDSRITPIDTELFGAGLVNMMEMNKRMMSLTTLGAPLGAIAKGLLLNQTLHSVYLIRSKGQYDDTQMMGHALAFTRSLLVFWMGGSDDGLLGPLHHQMQRQRAVEEMQEQNLANISESSAPGLLTPLQRMQSEQYQKNQEQQQRSNSYRDLHLGHSQDDQPELRRLQELQQRLQDQNQQYKQHRIQDRQQHQKHQQQTEHHGAQSTIYEYGTILPREISSAFKAAFVFQPLDSNGEKQRKSISQGAHQTESGSVHGHNTALGSRSATQINMGSGGVGGVNGGSSGSWLRNPIIEGIRRNHSLIKVTLDSSISSSLPMNSSPSTSGEVSSSGGRQMGHSRNNTASNDVFQEPSIQELHQFQLQYLHQIHKKVNSNRKILKERGRVGWEELKVLGLDDDIIREVCQDI